MAVYTTNYSSNHAGIIDTYRAEHGFFPTTNRLSRKHHPLSDNRRLLSDMLLHSLGTIKERFPFSP
jgi:hypothetical protein